MKSHGAKICAGFMLLGLVLSATPAMSADSPENPVELVVPFAAGGATDALAGGDRFGQPSRSVYLSMQWRAEDPSQ